jgi:hypothetical protein
MNNNQKFIEEAMDLARATGVPITKEVKDAIGKDIDTTMETFTKSFFTVYMLGYINGFEDGKGGKE